MKTRSTTAKKDLKSAKPKAPQDTTNRSVSRHRSSIQGTGARASKQLEAAARLSRGKSALQVNGGNLSRRSSLPEMEEPEDGKKEQEGPSSQPQEKAKRRSKLGGQNELMNKITGLKSKLKGAFAAKKKDHSKLEITLPDPVEEPAFIAAYADEAPADEELNVDAASPLEGIGHKVVDRTGHYYAHIEAERHDSSVATPEITI